MSLAAIAPPGNTPSIKNLNAANQTKQKLAQNQAMNDEEKAKAKKLARKESDATPAKEIYRKENSAEEARNTRDEKKSNRISTKA